MTRTENQVKNSVLKSRNRFDQFMRTKSFWRMNKFWFSGPSHAAFGVLGFWLLTVAYLVLFDEDEPHNNKKNKDLKIHALLKWRNLKDSKSVEGVLRSSNPLKHGEYVIHVCLTSDENTVMGMIAAVSSIHTNTKHTVMFHLVLPEKLTKHVRNWIENTRLSSIKYEIKVFDPALVEGKVKVRGGRPELAKPMNYARYYYSQLFPDLHGKVIHIDDDCIVQGDIHDLYKTNLGTTHIAAFSEDCNSVSKRFSLFKNIYANFLNFNSRHIKKLHLSPGACSFNTGVYVVDLDRWRAANITSELEHWIKLNTKEDIYGNEKGGGGSQPPMMIVLYKKYSILDPMWHVRHLGWTAGTRYSSHFIAQAKLLHWNGRFKPWTGKAQYAHIWDKYYIADPSKEYLPVRKRIF